MTWRQHQQYQRTLPPATGVTPYAAAAGGAPRLQSSSHYNQGFPQGNAHGPRVNCGRSYTGVSRYHHHHHHDVSTTGTDHTGGRGSVGGNEVSGGTNYASSGLSAYSKPGAGKNAVMASTGANIVKKGPEVSIMSRPLSGNNRYYASSKSKGSENNSKDYIDSSIQQGTTSWVRSNSLQSAGGSATYNGSQGMTKHASNKGQRKNDYASNTQSWRDGDAVDMLQRSGRGKLSYCIV